MVILYTRKGKKLGRKGAFRADEVKALSVALAVRSDDSGKSLVSCYALGV